MAMYRRSLSLPNIDADDITGNENNNGMTLGYTNRGAGLWVCSMCGDSTWAPADATPTCGNHENGETADATA